MSLTGLKVLVTRPQGQQQELVSLLQQAGAQVQSYPVLAITALDEQRDEEAYRHCQQQWQQLDQCQHVIFVSTNAVRFSLPWWQPQQLAATACYAIGKATARALRQQGLNAVCDGEVMNSEALLALPQLQQIAGERVLIVRGVGGREHLARQLEARGASVHYAECYRRQLPAVPDGELAALMRAEGFDVLCVHSGESLDNLRSLLADQAGLLQQQTLLVPGERVARLAEQRGCRRVLVAQNASSQAMLAALQQSYRPET